MTMECNTSDAVFILLGFHGLQNLHGLFFFLLLLIYETTITANALIIALVATNPQLWSPMYFFLSHLSLCDILISTDIGPFALQVILKDRCPISALSCYIQFYIFGGSVTTECCLLTLMAYDRYLAICNPLHYSSIMQHHLPLILASLCWLLGFFCTMITEILVSKLLFCGPNIIDHFFCDLGPVLELAYSDTKTVEVYVSVVTFIIAIIQMFFIMVTYICIFKSILHISSASGRQKIFSTCSSHLMVVSTFYGTLITVYLIPAKEYSVNLSKALSLLNTIITPLFNPIIYSLRNKEIQITFTKTVLKRS